MTGGFAVSSEELSSKSDAIGEVARSIRECVAASDELGVGGLVYGILFDPTMLPALSESKDALASTIGSVADTAQRIATNLKQNASTYASVEEFLTSRFGTIQTDTGGAQ